MKKNIVSVVLFSICFASFINASGIPENSLTLLDSTDEGRVKIHSYSHEDYRRGHYIKTTSDNSVDVIEFFVRNERTHTFKAPELGPMFSVIFRTDSRYKWRIDDWNKAIANSSR